jgi:hypothetical protein
MEYAESLSASLEIFWNILKAAMRKRMRMNNF